jgi:hopene-associated glycosyltransferase HpnB
MTLPAALALLAWLWLVAAHGRFWEAGPVLAPSRPAASPPIAVVVPARDEAAVVARSMGSLLAQDYAGPLGVVLVDDASGDGTGAIVRALGGVTVLEGAARPPGWAGKLWAVAQGVAATDAPWLLFTDADIKHDPSHVASLLAHAERHGLDMVSEMVALHCASLAERMLVPAFVYLFQLLYPFAWVNDPRRRTAAAAGGTVLIRRAALERIGGIAAIRGALIDDVALARAVKHRQGRIWLGHSALARSMRAYPGFADIWRMIARSAYVQLRCSPLLLAATTLGLAVLFLAPPAAAIAGTLPARALGLLAWALMAASLLPTLRRLRRSPLWALLLPAVAAFYMAATIGSAIDHHRGRGVVWKRRAYTERQA